MAEPAAIAVGVNAGLSAMKTLADATGSWRGWIPRQIQVARSKHLVDNKNSVLGFSPNLQKDKYAITPLIQALYRSDDRGSVSVAMIPPGLGTTTAVHFFLKGNKTAVREIALCRRERGTGASLYNNTNAQVARFAFNQPTRWFAVLPHGCPQGSGEWQQHTKDLCFLDEFVNETTDRVDSSLVEELKSLVRNTNIRIILLTPSQLYTDFLLSRNNLQGIVPLAGTYPIDQYPSGRWQSMVWPVATIRVAARNEHCLASYDSTEHIDGEIDRFMATLEPGQVQELTYLRVLSTLQSALDPINTLKQLDVAESASVHGGADVSCNACFVS